MVLLEQNRCLVNIMCFIKRKLQRLFILGSLPVRKDMFISSKNEGENKPYAVNLK